MRISVVPALVLSGVLAASYGCSEARDPTSSFAGRINVRAVTPRVLIGFAGAEVDPTPEVRLTDASGAPVAGVQVTFEVTAGGGSVVGGSVVSDAEGRAAAAAWVLGNDEGLNALRASVPGGGPSSIQFSATGHPPCPHPCAAAGRLAFVRDGDIYIATDDDAGLVRLTYGGTYGQPTWSPDGQQIAFVHTPNDISPGMIYLMKTDGSDLRHFARGWSPAWSADGRRIAFAALDAGQTAIFVQPVEADLPTVRIGHERGYHDSPAWSPDGSRIAFVSDWTAFDFASEVYVANADGTDLVQLTDGFFGRVETWPSYTIYAEPAWSPDGGSLAVVTCREWQYYRCQDSSVGIIALDTQDFTLLATTTGFARPTWSPDGSSLTFARTCWAHACPSAVFQVTTDGTAEWLLINDAHSPAWRP